MPDLNSLQHSLRNTSATLRNTYPEALKIQLAVKAQKSVIIDEEATARELSAFAKAIHAWSIEQSDRDHNITPASEGADRWGFILFKESQLRQQEALQIEQSRLNLKDIRNFENSLAPRRQELLQLRNKLAAHEKAHVHPEGAAITTGNQLRSDINHLDNEITTFNTALLSTKKSKINEAAKIYYEAQKELGEKLIMLSRAGLEGLSIEVEVTQNLAQESAKIRQDVDRQIAEWRPRAAPVHAHGSDDGSFTTAYAAEEHAQNPFEERHSPSLPARHSVQSSLDDRTTKYQFPTASTIQPVDNTAYQNIQTVPALAVNEPEERGLPSYGETVADRESEAILARERDAKNGATL